jgi:antitoxin (DNA-binding transcriptional repressor) of toxin-antitoxin stability system
MKTVTPEYAALHLPELLEEVGMGEVILIAADGRPLARLQAVDEAGAAMEDTGPEAPSEEVEQAFHGD